MHSVAAIFTTREAAENAAQLLGGSRDRISVIAPDPVKPEDEGIGPALGGAVGGAVGVAAGSALGTAAASLLLPGIGPVIATGIAAAVLFGAGGAVAGAAAGGKMEESAGVDPTHNPRDVFFYHEALRRGRAIVLALAETGDEAAAIRKKLLSAGADDLEVIREAWWTDLRDSEKSGYPGDFSRDENDYRIGFEAALEGSGSDVPSDDVSTVSAAYRRGYERGQQYFERISQVPLS